MALNILDKISINLNFDVGHKIIASYFKKSIYFHSNNNNNLWLSIKSQSQVFSFSWSSRFYDRLVTSRGLRAVLFS